MKQAEWKLGFREIRCVPFSKSFHKRSADRLVGFPEDTSMYQRCCLTVWGLLCTVGVAEAGMPSASYTISEASKMRVETLSFFLAGFFLSAFCIMQLWNCLTKEFTILPRITFGKALALVTLWGLLFILVLTMISGARELMTPGAWQKNGATYQLTQPVRK